VQEYLLEDRQIGVDKAVGAKRKTGSEQGAAEALTVADSAASTIPPRTSAAAGAKEVGFDRIVDHPEVHPVVHRHCNRDCEVGHTVHEVGGAVQGVHDPCGPARVAALPTGLFGEHAVIWIASTDSLDDGVFRRMVCGRDEIVERFF